VLIGRVRLPISALAAGRQAHAVLDEDGRPLVGASQQPSMLHLVVAAEPSRGRPGDSAGAEEGGGAGFGVRQEVEIRVGSVRHLPKMDIAGACDPYVLLSLGGERRKTRVFKKTYNATFDERFVMAALAHDEELLVNLFDWDYIGQVQRCLLLSLFISAPLSLLLASLPSVLLSVSSTHHDASCQSVQPLSMHPVNLFNTSRCILSLASPVPGRAPAATAPR